MKALSEVRKAALRKTFSGDYETLYRCTYPVDAPHTMEGEADCGERAIVRIWWDDYEHPMYACPEHFTVVTGQPA